MQYGGFHDFPSIKLRVPGEMRPNQADRPWNHIQFDFIYTTHFMPKPDGYCLVIVCLLTGYVILIAVRTRSHVSTMESIYKNGSASHHTE